MFFSLKFYPAEIRWSDTGFPLLGIAIYFMFIVFIAYLVPTKDKIEKYNNIVTDYNKYKDRLINI